MIMCIICTQEYNTLNNLEELWCDRCPSVTSIPYLPCLKTLSVYCCKKLTSLPIIPWLETLYITSCLPFRLSQV